VFSACWHECATSRHLSSFDAQAAFQWAVPPALATLFGLHETGDGVLSSREVRHVRQAAIWPSHAPHAAAGRNGHYFGSAPLHRGLPTASLGWPTASSMRSKARTGTRNSRPTLIVGISPRSAALYELSRLRSKYFFPASGTLIVKHSLLSGICAPQARLESFPPPYLPLDMREARHVHCMCLAK
jgi:hypothetical protein